MQNIVTLSKSYNLNLIKVNPRLEVLLIQQKIEKQKPEKILKKGENQTEEIGRKH